MNFKPQVPQFLQEGRFEVQLFRSYFQKEFSWITSQHFKDQTIQQFYQILKVFFNYIQEQRKIQILKSMNEIFSIQIHDLDFFLNLMQDQLNDIAQKLQIKFIFIQTPLNTQKEFGEANFQIAKIIIQNNNTSTLSFIFGLQQQKSQYQIMNRIFTPNNQKNPINHKLDKSFEQNFPIQNQEITFPQKQDNLFKKQEDSFKKQDINFPLKQELNFKKQDINFPKKQEITFPQKQDKKQELIFAQKKDLTFPQKQNPQNYFQITDQNIFNLSSKNLQEEDQLRSTFQIQCKLEQDKKPNVIYNLTSSISTQTNTTYCDICCKTYQKNTETEILLQCCDKIVHRQCVENELKNSRDFFHNLKCFFCKAPYQLSFVKEIMDQKKFQENVKQSILLQSIEKCFNCQALISLLPEQKKQICQIKCENCHTAICSRCRKNFHGLQSKCQEMSQDIIKFFQGQQIIVCPFCDFIQTKDDGCNHVTCYQCKMDLCSVCSVDRRPILSHGNHFHRKGCTDYKVAEGKETIIKERRRDCELCQNSSDKHCYIPIDLQTYKKEKGFEFY